MTGPDELSLTSTAMTSRIGVEQDQADGRQHEIEGPLERVVDALEDRRPELEQRDRLAGHELGPVDQDLHRRGRDLDRDAALMAGIDELHRLVLREIRVGDDHFLDPLAGEDSWKSSRRPSERSPFSRRGVSEM